jgi:hypothetical protein
MHSTSSQSGPSTSLGLDQANASWHNTDQAEASAQLFPPRNAAPEAEPSSHYAKWRAKCHCGGAGFRQWAVMHPPNPRGGATSGVVSGRFGLPVCATKRHDENVPNPKKNRWASGRASSGRSECRSPPQRPKKWVSGSRRPKRDILAPRRPVRGRISCARCAATAQWWDSDVCIHRAKLVV